MSHVPSADLIDSQPLVYRIDSDDRIVYTNAAFAGFADSNGAAGLAEVVLGRSLLEFVEGIETRMIWRMLLDRARGGQSLAVPFRCDAPDERRILRMTLSARPDGHVEFISSMLGSRRRQPVPFYAAVSAPRSGELVTVCSWCCRVQADGWVEPEIGVMRLGLLTLDPPPISHGICEDCSERLIGERGLTSVAA